MKTLQTLSRRDALKLGAAAAISPVMIGLTGCTYTKQDLINDAQIVDNTVAAVLTALGQSALASEIQGYLTQFDEAVNNWQDGSTSQVIISICQDIELALGDVGLPVVIVAAADAAISGIELLVQNLSKNATGIVANAAKVQHVVRAKPAPAKSRRAAVEGWNKAIVGTPLALHTLHVPMF
jgi:hypothetical protein